MSSISDCELRIADSKTKPIRNPKSTIRNVLVGGVNSPVRAFRHVGGKPLIVSKGRGAFVYDSRGARYTDFIMGWGTLILGHNPPEVLNALRAAPSRSTILGLTTALEIELAALIAEAVPSVEQVRFTVSGTEACMTAVRLARAAAGRSGVLAFDGSYHGHSETLLTQPLRIPYNDREALERTIEQRGRELACVIIEPVAANMGVVPPQPGYLARLRELTSRHGILLIFDEVVTGFRLAYGGAQEFFRTSADLTVFGKIIGGGMPIGAVGGPARLMKHLAPEGEVYHGGTFAGHPLSMAAGIAALRRLKQHPPYERLESLGHALTETLRRHAHETGVKLQVNRVGSMLTVFFAALPVRNAAHGTLASRARFAAWANGLRARGLLVPPSPHEALFLSAAHTEQHVRRLLTASRAVFKTMAAA